MATSHQLPGHILIADAISQANAASADDACDAQKHRSSYRPAVYINDSPTPSVGIVAARSTERWVMLTSGHAPRLPEDWCTCGMPVEWVGCKVFERGCWKSGEDRRVEIEVLAIEEGNQLTDSVIQDEEAEERDCAAVDKDCSHCSQLGWTHRQFHVGGRDM